MLDMLKGWFKSFDSDFECDFDYEEFSFLNWLRSLFMLLGVYWLIVAVPMAIVNGLRGGESIGNDSFYIRYLDLRPFNFTPKYISQTVVRLLFVGLWCALVMLYGVFIYPFTHTSNDSGSQNHGGEAASRGESDCGMRRHDSPSPRPQTGAPHQPPLPQSQFQEASKQQKGMIVAAYRRGSNVYFRRSDGYEVALCVPSRNDVEISGYTATSVTVKWGCESHVYDIDGHETNVFFTPPG